MYITFYTAGKPGLQLKNKTQPKDLSFIEKEIQKKVDKFRYELNQELLSILSKEREKEDQREFSIARTPNPSERNKLESQYEKEREEASAKIYQFNQ